MQFFKKYINNKYFYFGFAFFIWLTIFDNQGLLVQLELLNVKNDLVEQKEEYNKQILDCNAAINMLQNDSNQLEKYGREKYYMKKDNEDVYIIVEDKNN